MITVGCLARINGVQVPPAGIGSGYQSWCPQWWVTRCAGIRHADAGGLADRQPRCQPGTWALTGYPPGTMRLRIGDYRVVYVVRDDVVLVTVVRVAHRREAYRDL